MAGVNRDNPKRAKSPESRNRYGGDGEHECVDKCATIPSFKRYATKSSRWASPRRASTATRSAQGRSSSGTRHACAAGLSAAIVASPVGRAVRHIRAESRLVADGRSAWTAARHTGLIKRPANGSLRAPRRLVQLAQESPGYNRTAPKWRVTQVNVPRRFLLPPRPVLAACRAPKTCKACLFEG